VVLALACALSSLVASHAGAAILTMGDGGTYATLAEAVAAAVGGDTILVRPGTYANQVATINVPLTIEGAGGPVLFTQTAPQLPGLKGFLVTNANTTVENITFQGASISDGNGANGAGIRYQAGNLTVINSQFNGDQDGILATPATAGSGSILIENSGFTGDGVANGPRAGLEHGIYIGAVASLTVMGSTFQGTLVGHDIKSRAAVTMISGNYLDDGLTGTTSYAVDLPDGGQGAILGNTIVQGPNTQNNTMIAYSEEDPLNTTWTNNSLLVSGNAFTNTNHAAIGVNNLSAGVTASIIGNTFNGVLTIEQGLASLEANIVIPGLPLLQTTSGAEAVPEPPAVASLLGLVLLVLIRRRLSPWRLVA